MHYFLSLIAFISLSALFLSLWFKKDFKIWSPLFALSMVCGFFAGIIDLVGLSFIAALLLFWIFYKTKQNAILFFAIIALSVCLKLRLLPGFYPVAVTDQFKLGLEGSLIGLFPLAFMVPLAKDREDLKKVFIGLLIGCVGIAFIAFLAVSSGTIRLNFHLPAFMLLRTFSNLVLTAIPEEGFFRGFVQKTISTYFKNKKWGNVVAIILSSLLFMAVHIFWSPNLAILAFTFIASLLYGTVYLLSGKIESAILCHFLLNLIHMTLFNYHKG